MNNKQIKSDSRETAITPLVLGIISVSLLIFSGLLDWFLEPYLEREKLLGIEKLVNQFTSLLQLPIASLIALAGLILGIKDLKSSKKKSAIIGIGLCGIVLIWTLWLLGELFTIGAGF
jgi:hypothetical protein